MPEHDFTVDHDAMRIVGTNYLPDSDGPFPTLVMLHGLGANRIEFNEIFRLLGRYLAGRSYAVVTFDFRHSKDSDGELPDMLPSYELADALFMTQWVLDQPFVDRSRMGLLGISLAGLIACCTVAKTDAYKALVLFNPTTGPNLLRVIGGPNHVSGTPYHYGDNALHPQFDKDLLALDPLADVLNFRGSTLLVAGGKDQVVPAAISQQFVDARRAANLPITHELIPDGNHSFTTPELKAKLFSIVADWLDENLK